MPKFYVTSGDFQCITDRPTPREAAVSAFTNYLPMNYKKDLAKITSVSEQGYTSEDEDKTFFMTSDLLVETGQIDQYKAKNWLK